MASELNPHSPRHDKDVEDDQIAIGKLREPGRLELDRASIVEGRHEKPQLKYQFLHPIKEAQLAKIGVLINKAMEIIDEESSELRLIKNIDALLRDYDTKSNLPSLPPRKDSVSAPPKVKFQSPPNVPAN